ncbi:hypothetical protein [Sporosarcina koreensis]|uniref:hypothetical protein n=1 Tax=Sporosarcina koreensis TaxID=334735 RepID=UPI0007544516|nr:hypothetical protein [Sporosarcina koreensis]
MADKATQQQSREVVISGGNTALRAVERAEKRKADALTVKIDVDVSEALTGLKAVQREARKAAQALREVEAQGNVINVLKADTRELIVSVSGDQAIVHNDYLVEGYMDLSVVSTKELTDGPARILVNVD